MAQCYKENTAQQTLDVIDFDVQQLQSILMT